MTVKRSEIYTPGHTSNAVSFMARRRATTHAAFLLPHLRLGDNVLDCGCGPGRITRDLARFLGPHGAVTGIDHSIDQVDTTTDASDDTTNNVHFEAADIYALPFKDGSFDLVFSHALFEHLKDPARAVHEILRVLKPGGIIALRSPDWGGFLLDPFGPDIEQAVRSYEQLVTKNGGDILAGRKLAGLLRNAGVDAVRPSATYEIYDDTTLITDYLAAQLDAVNSRSASAFRTWGRIPNATFAQAWGEAIGIKPV